MRDSASLLTHIRIEMSDACRMFFARQARANSQSLSQSSQVHSQRTDLLSVDGIAEPLPIFAFCSFSEGAGRNLLES